VGGETFNNTMAKWVGGTEDCEHAGDKSVHDKREFGVCLQLGQHVPGRGVVLANAAVEQQQVKAPG